MPNERLRVALLERGLTEEDLAEAVGVDPKTIERWVGGRTPYRRHRFAVAKRLGVDEAYLWPDALAPEQVASAAESEILTVYPHRWTVPRDIWGRVFDGAEREIDVLVYSGLFLAEDAGFKAMFKAKAESGVRIRILLGDPDGKEIEERGADEGIGESMSHKIRNVIVLYRPLRDVDGIEFRLHDTPLYNSIYRGDDDMLINAHVYGVGASQAPVLYLRRVAGGDMVTTYAESFERVWSGARALDD